jgi:hypothetical protein
MKLVGIESSRAPPNFYVGFRLTHDQSLFPTDGLRIAVTRSFPRWSLGNLSAKDTETVPCVQGATLHRGCDIPDSVAASWFWRHAERIFPGICLSQTIENLNEKSAIARTRTPACDTHALSLLRAIPNQGDLFA